MNFHPGSKQVPLKFGQDGPVVGRALARFDDEGNVIADLLIYDVAAYEKVVGSGHGSFSFSMEEPSEKEEHEHPNDLDRAFDDTARTLLQNSRLGSNEGGEASPAKGPVLGNDAGNWEGYCG